MEVEEFMGQTLLLTGVERGAPRMLNERSTSLASFSAWPCPSMTQCVGWSVWWPWAVLSSATSWLLHRKGRVDGVEEEGTMFMEFLSFPPGGVILNYFP